MILIKSDSCHADMRHSLNLNAPKSLVAGALPQTPLGRLQRSYSAHAAEFSWNRNLVRIHLRQIFGSTNGKKMDFRFNYTPDCTVSSMNFQKFSEEGLKEHFYCFCYIDQL